MNSQPDIILTPSVRSSLVSANPARVVGRLSASRSVTFLPCLATLEVRARRQGGCLRRKNQYMKEPNASVSFPSTRLPQRSRTALSSFTLGMNSKSADDLNTRTKYSTRALSEFFPGLAVIHRVNPACGRFPQRHFFNAQARK